MTVILLTGFEPFAGAARNPSWDAVRLVRDGWTRPETLEIACLPVEYGRAGDELLAIVDRLRPDVVVATGLADGRTGVTPERVAINVDDARIPDNAGARPIDEETVPGGPAAYFSSLPIRAAVTALHAAAISGSVSDSAGTFVCNHVFYRLMHAIETRGLPTRAGFVHVPAASAPRADSAVSADAVGSPASTLTLERIARGIEAVVHATLDARPDAGDVRRA